MDSVKDRNKGKRKKDTAITTPKTQEQALAVVAPTASELAVGFDGDKELPVPVGAVLPVVKILRESPKFEMPDGETKTSFRGFILYYHSVKQLYLKEFGPDSGGQPPDCSSVNGVVPCNGAFYRFILTSEGYAEICKVAKTPAEIAALDPAHPVTQVYLNQLHQQDDGTLGYVLTPECRIEHCGEAFCPAAIFGSKKIGDNSKACQDSIWMYVLIDEYKLPVFLKAGPSSLNKKDPLLKYLSHAPNIGAGGQYQTISTQFSLTTKSFKSGFDASCLVLSDPKVLDENTPEDVEKMHFLLAMYKSFKAKYLADMKQYVAADKNEEEATVNTEDVPY